MPSKAFTSFEDNRTDIDRLWKIHEEFSGIGPNPGRRPDDVEVLNKSAIVFVSACWESYVEDVATEAFDYMLAHAPTASIIPQKVRVHAARPLLEKPDSEGKLLDNGKNAWDLAGNGWKTVLANHRATLIGRWLGNFHTPKSEPVDDLFEDLIGLKSLSRSWYWQGSMPKPKATDNQSKAATQLDEFITVRGDIAHRTKSSGGKVGKSQGNKFLGHVRGIVECTDSVVATHIESLVGSRPWPA